MSDAKSQGVRKKVLVADISATVRRLIINYLKDEYAVLEADSAAEVTELIQKAHECDSSCLKQDVPPPADGKGRIGLIVLGLEMGDENAFEIIKHLRKKHSKRCLPVILSTSNNDRETVLEAIKDGINDIAVKPFPKEYIISKIHKLEHEVHPENIRISEIVSKIPFFNGVPEAQVAYILSTCSETVLREPGEAVCHQDEEKYDLFILLEGRCEVFFNQRKVGDVLPVDTIGEMGFVAHSKRSATVKAAVTSKVVILDKKKFDAYLNEERAVSEMILKNIILSLNERIKKSNALINKLKSIAEAHLSD